jgi:uncharacterized protein (DUF433 family)
MDWKQCPDVEIIPGKVSGALLVKGTRIPVQAILDHADEFTPEEIDRDLFPGVGLERARRIIAYAQHGAHAAHHL